MLCPLPQVLVDAVNATIDASSAPVDTATSWGAVEASLSASRWKPYFPRGRADWAPITMLPAERWRELLVGAGFQAHGGALGGSVDARVVDTAYPDALALSGRLRAAWGPMFPTLPANTRAAFFQAVAETAVAQASRSPCDPAPVVVRSRVIDIAVPTS